MVGNGCQKSWLPLIVPRRKATIVDIAMSNNPNFASSAAMSASSSLVIISITTLSSSSSSRSPAPIAIRTACFPATAPNSMVSSSSSLSGSEFPTRSAGWRVAVVPPAMAGKHRFVITTATCPPATCQAS